jgi:hypothetical protein
MSELAHGPADFASRGYRVLHSLLPEPLRAFLYEYAVKSARAGKLDPGDKDVPNTPCRYGDPIMEALLKALEPRVVAETALSLFPTYSYFRVYQPGDVLKPHHDRPSCEVSVTINLGHEAPAPWPLWVETQHGPLAIELQPGDGALYKGIEVRHWRTAFAGTRAVQVFLHYVNQNGPHWESKFDGRGALSASPAADRTIEMLMERGRTI